MTRLYFFQAKDMGILEIRKPSQKLRLLLAQQVIESEGVPCDSVRSGSTA
jgi:hypothetical protein